MMSAEPSVGCRLLLLEHRIAVERWMSADETGSQGAEFERSTAMVVRALRFKTTINS